VPEAIERKLAKISGATDVASAVLLSSLQRLVEKGWSKLEFSEDLIGSDKALQSGDAVVLGSSIPYIVRSSAEEWMAKITRRFD
jgi:hypothetical protein